MKKHYCVYKITNITNNKFYIGAHETYDLWDSYMGSGKNIKRALKKYGVANFKKEILFTLTSREEMYLKEAELVTLEFIERKDTYNLTLGGYGGFHHLNSDISAMKARNSNAAKIWNSSRPKEFYEEFHKIGRKAMLEKYPNGTKSSFHHNKKLQEKANKASQTEKAQLKRKESFKKINHSQGEKNSQFGTCWIYNLELKENKKIIKSDLDIWISEGWVKGRKIIF